MLNNYQNILSTIKDKLADLVLPGGVRLYLGSGIDNLFEKLDIDGQVMYDKWLFLPDSICNNGNDEFSSSLNFDNKRITPIVIGNNVEALVIAETGSELISENIKNEIFELIGQVAELNISQKINISDELITSLFRHDSDLDSFTKRFLKIILNYCPDSCAGLYYHDGLKFQLRFALGNLNSIDLLRGSLEENMASSWKDKLSEGKYLIPADLIPAEISYLPQRSEYYFVYPGINTGGRESLLCFTLDKNIAPYQIELISNLCGFYHNLDESQFASSSQVLSLYENLMLAPGEIRDIERILTNLYEYINAQLALKELVWIDDNKVQWILKQSLDSECTEIEKTNKFNDFEYSDLLNDKNKIICEETPYSSHMIFKVNLPDNKCGYLKFVAGIDSGILNKYKDLLICAETFLQTFYWLGWYPKSSSDVLRGESHSPSVDNALKRFDTIGKLVDGYYHHIYSLMSVVIGQTDLLSSFLEINETEKLSDGIKKVNVAADDVTEQLRRLQSIYPGLSQDFEKTISCKAFLKLLPDYIQGFLTRIKDNKNISLRIQVDISSDYDFNLKVGDVYDSILPLIIRIVEQSICSGVISFKIEKNLNRSGLFINFNSRIIEHTSIEQLLEELFIYHDFNRTDNKNTEIKFDNINLKVTSNKEIISLNYDENIQQTNNPAGNNQKVLDSKGM